MQKLEAKKADFELIMQYYPPKLDVSGHFDVSERTLDRFVRKHYAMSYDDLRDKRFGKTRIAIRKKQIDKALAGDKTMLVWLGKQYLGQSEKIEQKTELNAADIKEVFLNWGDEPNAPQVTHEEKSNTSSETH